MSGLLLRNAELGRWAGARRGGRGDAGGPITGGRVADVRVGGGRVTEVGAGLARQPGEEEYDCRGAAVLPGLCDHHLHLHAMAAWAASARCGPPDVTGPGGLAAALASAPADEHGWVRGTGYTESVAGDLDAAALDRLLAGQLSRDRLSRDRLSRVRPSGDLRPGDRPPGDRPVRVQHRSGALWMLNTAALAAIGVAGPGGPGADHPGVERDASGCPTGRLWRADDWLRSRLPPARPPGLAGVGAALLACGITAVTDATPDLDARAVAAIGEAMGRGDLPQQVVLLGAPLGTSLPTGRGVPGEWGVPGVARGRGVPGVPGQPGPPGVLDEQRLPGPAAGPYKIVLADSGLPGCDELTGRIRAAHAAGRPVAVHCVTREALVLLVTALGDAGPLAGDRIEHAALVPPELVPVLARLGVRVVTQPGFLPDRGDDFLRGLPPADRPDLYRCASLRRAGVPVALSSDAPYGPADPWAVMAAAVARRTASGKTAGPGERITFRQALGGYLAPPGDPGGPPRRVRPGLAADLAVLHVPLAGLPGLAQPVRAVVTGGSLREPEPAAAAVHGEKEQ